MRVEGNCVNARRKETRQGSEAGKAKGRFRERGAVHRKGLDEEPEAHLSTGTIKDLSGVPVSATAPTLSARAHRYACAHTYTQGDSSVCLPKV